MYNLLTRHDKDIGVGDFDSIEWLFSEHLKEPDDKSINSAIVKWQKEDNPQSISFFKEKYPFISSEPVRKWRSEEEALRMQMEDAEESYGFPK